VRYNELAGTLKLALSGANEPKEQRYRPIRKLPTNKLADYVFWLCRYKNQTRAMPEQKTFTDLDTPKAANALLTGK